MFFSGRFLRNIAGLVFAAILYALAGLPLVHPILHSSCEGHCCEGGRQKHNQGFSTDEKASRKIQTQCGICVLLQGFHLFRSTFLLNPTCTSCPVRFQPPLLAGFRSGLENSDLLARPPPLT